MVKGCWEIDGRCSHCSFPLPLTGMSCGVKQWRFRVLEEIKGKSNVVQWVATREGPCSAFAQGAEDSKVCDVVQLHGILFWDKSARKSCA